MKKLLIFLFFLKCIQGNSQELVHQSSPGFFTPPRTGQIWDTWLIHDQGTWYMFYLAGRGGQWDGHELATSPDGINWKFNTVLLHPLEGTVWMGTGHLWKSPFFATDSTWISNYSEWHRDLDKQDIMFATSKNLTEWEKVDEKLRFVQDTRWYREKGRWDCIDVMKGDDGYLYGYFTADPDSAKVDYEYCGFGFARSRDGMSWEALPPVPGDMHGEFGGIEKIGDKYYILISEGRVGVGDSFRGPFHRQQKNHSIFQGDIYFPRFFHARDTPDGKPLVNHFYTKGVVYSAPLKDIDIDREGILRLKWWKGNDKLKSRLLDLPLETEKAGVRMTGNQFLPGKTYVVEGSVKLPSGNMEHEPAGIWFGSSEEQGKCIVFSRDKTSFADGNRTSGKIELKNVHEVSRDLDYGLRQDFRMVLCNDMAEVYVNNYLTVIQRVGYDGYWGIFSSGKSQIKNLKIWVYE